MPTNIGETALRRRRRSTDPMRTFDALPAPLRRWLSEAALPWSPASARRQWEKAIAKGLSIDEALNALSRAAASTLARDAKARRTTA